MSVSEAGLTALPSPGFYGNGVERYEIRISQRGHWYGLRQEPDGSTTYVAQDIELDNLTAVSERQPSGCEYTGCTLPQWHRGLCGIHLAADAVRYAKAVA